MRLSDKYLLLASLASALRFTKLNGKGFVQSLTGRNSPMLIQRLDATAEFNSCMA